MVVSNFTFSQSLPPQPGSFSGFSFFLLKGHQIGNHKMKKWDVTEERDAVRMEEKGEMHRHAYGDNGVDFKK